MTSGEEDIKVGWVWFEVLIEQLESVTTNQTISYKTEILPTYLPNRIGIAPI